MPRPESLQLDKRLYRKALAEYEELWKRGNEFLYTLCAESPGHADLSVVTAKVWLISRAYSADPARHGIGREEVARHLHSNSRAVDGIFRELHRISPARPTLNEEILERVVIRHSEFMGLLREINPKGRETRSFVSKYMHCHCPDIVPIFDSLASSALRSIVSRKDAKFLSDIGDKDYCVYCNRFLALWHRAIALNLEPTVKLLDEYLLALKKSRDLKR